MNEAEAVGDLAQGAMAARAVEPQAGETDDGHTHESACLNCGTPLVGPHCHNCGQAAHVHRTIGAFFHDLLHGVFHFEGKVWRTLPVLALHPGRLTREYIDGKRATYVSPIALFLFSVFLLFAAARQFSEPMFDAANVDVNGRRIVGLEANLAEIERLEAERDRLATQGADTSAIDGEIDGREEGIAILRGLNDGPGSALDELEVEATGSPTLDNAIARLRANPQLVAYQLQTYAYKYSWALVPVSVPFVWLLFAFNGLRGRRRFGLYDHTVFVTYSICFVSLLVALAMVLSGLGVPGTAGVVGLIVPVHMYRQLRGAYALGRLGALGRTAALLVISLAALLLVTVLQLVLALG